MWTAALTLARHNWQAIAVALLIGVCYLRIAYISHERDAAVSNLTKTTNLIRDNALKAEAEKALLAEQGAKQRKSDQAEAIKNAQIIGNAFNSMLQKAKNEKRTLEINSTATADHLRDELREQSAIIASRRRPEDDPLHPARIDGITAIPGRTEEESKEFYRSAYAGAVRDLRICKLSAASCASDFNECRAYVLGEQGRIGVTGRSE